MIIIGGHYNDHLKTDTDNPERTQDKFADD